MVKTAENIETKHNKIFYVYFIDKFQKKKPFYVVCCVLCCYYFCLYSEDLFLVIKFEWGGNLH